MVHKSHIIYYIYTHYSSTILKGIVEWLYHLCCLFFISGLFLVSKDISTPLALVVGHESYGVSAGALRVCDEQVRITTVGIKTFGRDRRLRHWAFWCERYIIGQVNGVLRLKCSKVDCFAFIIYRYTYYIDIQRIGSRKRWSEKG